MANRKYPARPDSLDPADWWMYCDLLQEANAPPARWRWAKRVGDSLHTEPRLLLYTVNGYYLPRVVSHARFACVERHGVIERVRSGTSYPVWVKPAHIHLLRWFERKDTNDEVAKSITPSAVIEDAFTPDCLTTRPHTLALYRYACDYGAGLKAGRWGEEGVRSAFIECHGRQGVAFDLDARKEWHI